MREHQPIRYVFIIGLFISLFLDGSISLIFSHLLYGKYILVPSITFAWLFFGMYFINRTNEHVEIWASIAGLLFDLFYTGILGVYVIVFTLAIIIGRKLYRFLPMNIVTGLFSFAFNIALINVLAYGLNRLMNATNMAAGYFLIHAVIPTVLFNSVLFLILYVPIGVLFDRIE